MKILRAIREFWEWLPVLAMPVVVALLTDNFSRNLSAGIWIILGLALAVNLAWIGFVRFGQNTAEFYKKYPNFRMRK